MWSLIRSLILFHKTIINCFFTWTACCWNYFCFSSFLIAKFLFFHSSAHSNRLALKFQTAATMCDAPVWTRQIFQSPKSTRVQYRVIFAYRETINRGPPTFETLLTTFFFFARPLSSARPVRGTDVRGPQYEWSKWDIPVVKAQKRTKYFEPFLRKTQIGFRQTLKSKPTNREPYTCPVPVPFHDAKAIHTVHPGRPPPPPRTE